MGKTQNTTRPAEGKASKPWMNSALKVRTSGGEDLGIRLMGPSTSPEVNRQGEEGQEDRWGSIREETWTKHHLGQTD